MGTPLKLKAPLLQKQTKKTPSFTFKDNMNGGFTAQMKLEGRAIGTLDVDEFGADQFYVGQVHVDDAHQGEGLGKLMYEASAEEVKRRGGRVLASDSLEEGDVSPGALRVWKSLERTSPSVKFNGNRYYFDLR